MTDVTSPAPVDRPWVEEEHPPFRVLVVDDSAVIRGLITRLLEAAPGISVVASASNGAIALTALKRHAPEVVVLDVEMPVMDGLTALPQLLAADPDVGVIMVSTLTLRNAEISLRALAAGAADYVPKPTSSRELTSAADFRRELVDKVKALGAARRARGRLPLAPAQGWAPPLRRAGSRTERSIALRPRSARRPELLAIGSSTGGPQALARVLSRLGGEVTQPVLVTQHMPATFTAILATHLERASGRSCAEAQDGEPVRPGRIYVAPGGFHMLVANGGTGTVIRLSDAPPEHFCKPAVDPMLRSVAEVYGGAVLAIILTGMGNDGLSGCGGIVDAGGTVIAQDEATSVVWGMPGAVAGAGLCSAVLPIDGIGPCVARLATERSP